MTLSMWARPAHGISSFSPSSAYSASSPSPADRVSLERKIRKTILSRWPNMTAKNLREDPLTKYTSSKQHYSSSSDSEKRALSLTNISYHHQDKGEVFG